MVDETVDLILVKDDRVEITFLFNSTVQYHNYVSMKKKFMISYKLKI